MYYLSLSHCTICFYYSSPWLLLMNKEKSTLNDVFLHPMIVYFVFFSLPQTFLHQSNTTYPMVRWQMNEHMNFSNTQRAYNCKWVTLSLQNKFHMFSEKWAHFLESGVFLSSLKVIGADRLGASTVGMCGCCVRLWAKVDIYVDHKLTNTTWTTTCH